jgi:hypothetical protein
MLHRVVCLLWIDVSEVLIACIIRATITQMLEAVRVSGMSVSAGLHTYMGQRRKTAVCIHTRCLESLKSAFNRLPISL